MTPPITIAIAMHVRCARCQSSIHLGAIVDRARCPKCGHVEALGYERWKKALDSATYDGPSLPENDPDKQLNYDEDEIWLIATRVPPQCASCEKPLPPGAAHNGRTHGKCFCTSCGGRIAVRPVPPGIAPALPCVTHLLGEDAVQMKQPEAPIPDPSQVVSVRCPDCGGNIAPDGRSRAVRCPYCSVIVVLPQAVWARLHTGKNDPHRFYLVHDPTVPRPLGRADVKWASLDGLACDPLGNVYGVGEAEGFGDDRIVFALDNRLQTKWVRKSLPIDDDASIAWRNDGTLVVWSPQRYSAVLLRSADGQEIGKVGGQQPKDLDRHVLDLASAESLAIDFDGTFLFSKHDRIVRCTSDGSGTFTWPPGQGLLGGLLKERLYPFGSDGVEDAEWVENAGDRPTKLHNPTVRIGWDGRTYFQRSNWLAAYDRSGKRLWRAELPDRGNDYDFGVDARGIVYVLRWLESSTHGIYRIYPGGSCSLLVDGRSPETPLREDRRIAVHPDGTIFVGNYGRQIRIFSPAGRLLHRSPEAIEEDEDHAKRRAEEEANDRVR